MKNSKKSSPDHIDFHISYQCNNKCIFCSSAEAIREFKNHPLKLKNIVAILKKRKKDFKGINFTGGEPTLYPYFKELVKTAKNFGYKIYIGSNGGRFSDKNFCRETAPFINEICFSVHGHNSRLHNFHTKNSRSFENLDKAFDNVSDYKIALFSNSVITRYNFPHLKKIFMFLASKKIKQALFSNIAPEGDGLKNYKKLTVKLADIKKTVPQLVELADQKNIVLRFFGIPLCILGKYATYSNDFFWDARMNIEQVGPENKHFIKEEKAYLPERKRIKTEKCHKCFYKKICGGVFEEYYKNFGDQELKPIENG